jgi:hypothetical protein
MKARSLSSHLSLLLCSIVTGFGLMNVQGQDDLCVGLVQNDTTCINGDDDIEFVQAMNDPNVTQIVLCDGYLYFPTTDVRFDLTGQGTKEILCPSRNCTIDGTFFTDESFIETKGGSDIFFCGMMFQRFVDSVSRFMARSALI